MNGTAEQIKSAITMRQLLQGYGFEINRAGFMRCPFHHEKTASFKVYEKDYHCYGCRVHGDAIKFVMEYFNLTFPQAILKISSDFRIYTDFKNNKTPAGEAEKIRKQRAKEKAEREKRDKEYFEKAAEFRQVQQDLFNFQPKSEYDFVHQQFIDALKKRDYLEWWLTEHFETERR
jgi:DNA primase